MLGVDFRYMLPHPYNSYLAWLTSWCLRWCQFGSPSSGFWLFKGGETSFLPGPGLSQPPPFLLGVIVLLSRCLVVCISLTNPHVHSHLNVVLYLNGTNSFSNSIIWVLLLSAPYDDESLTSASQKALQQASTHPSDNGCLFFVRILLVIFADSDPTIIFFCTVVNAALGCHCDYIWN